MTLIVALDYEAIANNAPDRDCLSHDAYGDDINESVSTG
jgi:hypothetical protein